MKKIICLLTCFITLHAIAQTTNISVLKQNGLPDTTYQFTPGSLLMQPQLFTANADSIFINFELRYTNPFDSTVYVTKETFSRWTAKVSVTKWMGAFGTDGVINKTSMNAILLPFKLQLQ